MKVTTEMTNLVTVQAANYVSVIAEQKPEILNQPTTRQAEKLLKIEMAGRLTDPKNTSISKEWLIENFHQIDWTTLVLAYRD
jgi:hypothetical protein